MVTKKEWEDWKKDVKRAILGALENIMEVDEPVVKKVEKEEEIELDLSPYVGKEWKLRLHWYIIFKTDYKYLDVVFSNKSTIDPSYADKLLTSSFAQKIASKEEVSFDLGWYSEREGLAELLTWGSRYIPWRVKGILEALEGFAIAVRNLVKAKE